MKTIFSEYYLYYSNNRVASVWLHVSPIAYMRKHFKKYYPNAIAFKRVFHDGNSTSNLYSL